MYMAAVVPRRIHGDSRNFDSLCCGATGQQSRTNNGERRGRRRCGTACINVFANNQAAIRSLTRPEGKPEGRSGSYILRQIVEGIDSLQTGGYEVAVRWIPSHKGIEGNEAADIAAKKATGWREGSASGPRATLPPELYSFHAPLKIWSRKQTKESWQIEWQQETRGRASFRNAPVPSERILQLHEGLSKRQRAIVVQLRTEKKIGLRDFVFRRRVQRRYSSRGMP